MIGARFWFRFVFPKTRFSKLVVAITPLRQRIADAIVERDVKAKTIGVELAALLEVL
jgi:hypothetical protein